MMPVESGAVDAVDLHPQVVPADRCMQHDIGHVRVQVRGQCLAYRRDFRGVIHIDLQAAAGAEVLRQGGRMRARCIDQRFEIGERLLQLPVRGLFLMVPPLTMGPLPALDAAAVPTSVVHAWHDELIPASGVIDWAGRRSARLLLVDDGHRLSAHVDTCARAFAELLATL